jgi:hypothetical protein
MKYDNLKQELNLFLINLNKYTGVGSFIEGKTQEEIKEYWEVVELCREVKKKMERIYERY